jgi:hypothetical protein
MDKQSCILITPTGPISRAVVNRVLALSTGGEHILFALTPCGDKSKVFVVTTHTILKSVGFRV